MFARLERRAVVKDPTLMFLWRGLDIRRKLGLGGALPPLQEPDPEDLRSLEKAAGDKGKKRGKGAEPQEAQGSFIRKEFGRRFIVRLAGDAATGFMRDSKASRVSEASFSSESLTTEIRVWHGTTSFDRAVLRLEPLPRTRGRRSSLSSGTIRTRSQSSRSESSTRGS